MQLLLGYHVIESIAVELTRDLLLRYSWHLLLRHTNENEAEDLRDWPSQKQFLILL